MKRRKKCPICKKWLVPIIYGMPMGDELIKKHDNKEIFLGGCMIELTSPKYHCYNCNKSFREEEIKKYKKTN